MVFRGFKLQQDICGHSSTEGEPQGCLPLAEEEGPVVTGF